MLKCTAIFLASFALLGAAHARAKDAPAPPPPVVDPEDAKLDVPVIIAKNGYPVEVHDVTTSDGYILQLHRIPRGRDAHSAPGPRPAVFLMHGLLSSSADYIIMGPGYGLGYILAEEGFDVWLANARGNYYSRRHVSLNPDRSGFWDFSWDEIGQFDLSAGIDYVLATTDEAIVHYIGHSQGTTAFFVLMSLRPEYNVKIGSAHMLAPVAFFRHLDAPGLLDLAAHTNLLASMGSLLGLHELFSRNSTFRFDENGEVQCIENGLITIFCEQFKGAFASESADQFYLDMMPIVIGHTPSGSSLRQFAHYGQVADSQVFRRWNFPLALQNRLAYGTSPAPTYDISKITAHICLYYSLADALTPEADVIDLASILPDATVHLVSEETFTHFDFAWGSRARENVYDYVIHAMRNFIANQRS